MYTMHTVDINALNHIRQELSAIADNEIQAFGESLISPLP